MTRIVDVVIGAGWILFWMYWIAMAIKIKRPTQPRSSVGILIRLILFTLLLLSIKSLPRQWGVVHGSPHLQAIGFGLYVLGLLLAIWARIYLGGNWGFPADKRRGTELITAGPYRLIRHPIYTGILLAMLGTAIALTWYWILITLILGAYFVWSAIAEEKYMTKIFTRDYPAYVRRSKMFVPFIF